MDICALLAKPERRENDVDCRYVGFEIPNRFVIGYGLDFAERYRNLPYIGVLRDELVAASRVSNATRQAAGRRRRAALLPFMPGAMPP